MSSVWVCLLFGNELAIRAHVIVWYLAVVLGDKREGGEGEGNRAVE